MAASLNYRHVFGVKGNVRNGVHWVDDGTVLYPAGHHLVKLELESRTQELLTGSETSRGVTAVALSRQRRLVAVAEEGPEGQPARVYIYNVRRMFRTKTLVSEESSAARVESLAFSKDDSLLVSIGGAPDWRLCVWKVDSARLVASTSLSGSTSARLGGKGAMAHVRGATFNPDDATKLAVFGSGLFQFLSLEDDGVLSAIPASAAFAERPPREYLSHAWLEDEMSVLGTNEGELLLFLREVFLAQLPQSPGVGLPIDCLQPFERGFLCAGEGGAVRMFTPTEEEGVYFANTKTFALGPAALGGMAGPGAVAGSAGGGGGGGGGVGLLEDGEEGGEGGAGGGGGAVDSSVSLRVHTLAVSPSTDRLAALTCGNQLLHLDLAKAVSKGDTAFTALGPASHGPAPDSAIGPGDPSYLCAVTAMDIAIRKPVAVTAGIDQTVRLWNWIDKSQEHCEAIGEPISAVAMHPAGTQLLIGLPDRLRLVAVLMDELHTVKDLPIKGCRECKFAHGGHVFAAANGPHVQVYNALTCHLIATLRGHTGRIYSLRWSRDDETLVSAGADGAIYGWNWRKGTRGLEFVNKAARYTCAVPTSTGRHAIAVGSDAKLAEIDLKAGTVTTEVAHSHVHGAAASAFFGMGVFSAVSEQSELGLVLSYTLPLSTGECVPYPASASSVTALELAVDDSTLLAAGADGALVVFSCHDKDGRRPLGAVPAGLGAGEAKEEEGGGEARSGAAIRLPWADEVLTTRALLEDMARQITELSESYDELLSNNEYNLRVREMAYQDEIKKLTERFQSELDQERTQLALLREEVEDLERDFGEQLATMEVTHRSEVGKREALYQHAIMEEVKKFQELAAEVDRTAQEQSLRRARQEEAHEEEERVVREELERRLDEARTRRVEMERDNEGLLRDWEEAEAQMDEDVDEEIEELKRRYEAKLQAERQTGMKCKSDTGILRNKFQQLKQAIDDQEEQVQFLEESKMKLDVQIASLEKELEVLAGMIRDKDARIAEKERHIYELKKKNQELEKFKFVLDHKIKELKRQIEPREREIARMRKHIRQVDTELQEYHRVNAELDSTIGKLREDLDALQKKATASRSGVAERKSATDRLLGDLMGLSKIMLEPDKLRVAIAALHKRHVPAGAELPRIASTVVEEYERQRGALEARLASLEKRLKAEEDAGRKESRRIVEANRSLIKDIEALRGRVAGLKAARQDVRAAEEEAISTDPATRAADAKAARDAAEKDKRDKKIAREAEAETILKLLADRRAEMAQLREANAALERALLAASAPASRIRPLRM